jgi:hypothetical protein
VLDFLAFVLFVIGSTIVTVFVAIGDIWDALPMKVLAMSLAAIVFIGVGVLAWLSKIEKNLTE